jgi:hypothetical protein
LENKETEEKDYQWTEWNHAQAFDCGSNRGKNRRERDKEKRGLINRK